VRRGEKLELGVAAERLLLALGTPDLVDPRKRRGGGDDEALECLVRADLVVARAGGAAVLTGPGRAHLARRRAAAGDFEIDPFLAQHLQLAQRQADTPRGKAQVLIDDTESPLAWLARRKGRDGRPLIEPLQLQAGEKLRAQFTRAALSPRTTSNWSAAIAQGRRARDGGGAAALTDSIVAARQQVRHALEDVGPEFSGLLVDVCCFLKGLEQVERERAWPPRSAKLVLQLGLDRLARHYGLTSVATGRARAPLRTWTAPEAAFAVDGN
jgi:Domain of unknown function (DUF6456)